MHQHTSVEVSGSGQIITKDSPASLSEKQVLSRRIRSTMASVITTVYVAGQYYYDEEREYHDDDDEIVFEGMSASNFNRDGGMNFNGNFFPADRVFWSDYKDGPNFDTCAGWRNDPSGNNPDWWRNQEVPSLIANVDSCHDAAKMMARRFTTGGSKVPKYGVLSGLTADPKLEQGCYMAADETFYWNQLDGSSLNWGYQCPTCQGTAGADGVFARFMTSKALKRLKWPLTPICKLRADQVLKFEISSHGPCEVDSTGYHPGQDIRLASVCKTALTYKEYVPHESWSYINPPEINIANFNNKRFNTAYGKDVDPWSNFLLDPKYTKTNKPPGCHVNAKRTAGNFNFVQKLGPHSSSSRKKAQDKTVFAKWKSVCMRVVSTR